MTTQLEQDVKLAESVGIQDEYGEDYKATILQIHAFANAIREQSKASLRDVPVAWLSDEPLAGSPVISAYLAESCPEYKQTYTVPLYTAPPRTREWVGLNGEEIAQLTLENIGYPVRLTKTIEAKLKEKNT
jgi:hypothetical protein